MKNHLWATRTWLARHRRTVAWRVKTLKRFLIIGCEVVNYHLQGFCDVPYTWLKLCAFDECSQDSFRFEHHGIEQGLRCRGGALLLEREFLVFTRIPWTGRNVRRLHFKAPTMCLRSKTSGSRFCRTQAKMTCTKCSVEQYDATLKILDWFSFWTEQQSSWRKSKWSCIHRTNEKISNFMYNGFLCMSYILYNLDVIHIYIFVTTKTPFQYHL